MYNIDVRTAIQKNRVNLQALITPQEQYAQRYIASATILLNGLQINHLTLTRSMAESPYISVRFKGFVNDGYKIICVDNLGGTHSRKGVIRK